MNKYLGDEQFADEHELPGEVLGEDYLAMSDFFESADVSQK